MSLWKQRGSEEKGCRKGSDLTEDPITLDSVLCLDIHREQVKSSLKSVGCFLVEF
jgi:hypothetical protein